MLAAITVMYLTTLGEIAFTWHLSLNVPNLMAEAPALAIWRHGYAKYIIFVLNNLIGIGLVVRSYSSHTTGVGVTHRSTAWQILRCHIVYEQKLYITIPATLIALTGTGKSRASSVHRSLILTILRHSLPPSRPRTRRKLP